MMSPIIIYGSETCEDTALVRDHLQALRIPYTVRLREQDPEAEQVIRRWNSDRIVTPTMIFGEPSAPAAALSEPTPQELEDKLRAGGYAFEPRAAIEFQNLSKMPAPDFSLPATDGSRFQLGALRGRQKSLLFFAHDHTCRVCQGYARQLVRKKPELGEYETRLVLVLSDGLEPAHSWSKEFAEGQPTLADEGGIIKQKYAAYFDQDAAGVLLLVLDAYTAPRAGSFGDDAGQLIIPHEALEWLRLLDHECAE